MKNMVRREKNTVVRSSWCIYMYVPGYSTGVPIYHIIKGSEYEGVNNIIEDITRRNMIQARHR